MWKQTVFKKTIRYNPINNGYLITEKLDGSNLCIAKVDNKIYVAQRNLVFDIEEIDELSKNTFYKGLANFLKEHKNYLIETLEDGYCIVGEWLAQGCIKYSDLENGYYLFAFGKAKMRDGLLYLEFIENDLKNINKAFKNEQTPIFKTVPIIADNVPVISLGYLNSLYEARMKETNRMVEGFVVYSYETQTALKYVRHKDGKSQEHRWEIETFDKKIG